MGVHWTGLVVLVCRWHYGVDTLAEFPPGVTHKKIRKDAHFESGHLFYAGEAIRLLKKQAEISKVSRISFVEEQLYFNDSLSGIFRFVILNEPLNSNPLERFRRKGNILVIYKW